MTLSSLEDLLRPWIGTSYLYGSRIPSVGTDCAFPLVVLSQLKNLDVTIGTDYLSIRNIVKVLGLKKVGKDSKKKDGDLLVLKNPGHLVGIGIVCNQKVWTTDPVKRRVYTLPLKYVEKQQPDATIWRMG